MRPHRVGFLRRFGLTTGNHTLCLLVSLPPRIPGSAPPPPPLGACVTLDIDWLTKKLTSTLLIHWRVIFLFKIHIKARFLLSGFPNNLFIFPISFSYVAKPFKGTGKEFRNNVWNLLCCSEFCQLELSKRDFRSAVDRLNSNVLHLCFTQVGKIITDTSNFEKKNSQARRLLS